MFNRNNLVSGLILGLILPIVTFGLLYQVFSLLEIKGAASSTGFSENFRERTLAIVAIAINIIPMRVFQGRRWETAIRGLVVATGVLALAWVGFFGMKLL
jgi:hypothetical protein